MHVKLDINFRHLADKATRETLRRIERKIDQTMANLDRITSEVRQTGDAVQGAITLLGDLAQRIRENATDEAALNDLADTLDQQGTALAEAVVANTPADTGGGDTPPVEPPVTPPDEPPVEPPADGGDGGSGGVPV